MNTGRLCSRVFLLLLAAFISIKTTAQENGSGNKFSLTDFIVDNTSGILEETGHFIDEHLDAKDSIYISPNLYNFTIMPQYSHYYEYYRFSSKEGEQSITLRPDQFADAKALSFALEVK